MRSHESIIAEVSLLLLVLLAIPLNGCVTKAHANAQAREAFLEGRRVGQQEALSRMQPQAQPQPQVQPLQEPTTSTQSVRIVGPVRNPVLPWKAELTLGQAIIDAGYASTTDPSDIVVMRNGKAFRVDPAQLLAGQDVPLLPGDIVQIK
jgi:hypothetical protein